MTQENAPLFEGTLYLSKHLDYFQNGDDFFVYHNLYGYILKMSEDLIDFLEFFAIAQDASAMVEVFGEVFGNDTLNEFLSIFRTLACLVPDENYEREKTLAMFPTQARWITVHAPKEGRVKIYVFDAQSRRDMRIISLNDWESALWHAASGGDKSVEEIIEEMATHKDSPSTGVDELVLASLAQWTHCELQILKLSAEPCSRFKGRRFGIPPYLISTMPYERVTNLVRTEVDEDGNIVKPYVEPVRVQPKGLIVEQVDELVLKSDRLSSRLSSLFASPHLVLQNRSYGERIFELASSVCNMKEEQFSVLDIGGGLGETAKVFVEKFALHHPDQSLSYVIFSPDEEFAQAQREMLGVDSDVEIIVGLADELSQKIGSRQFDFILCDEFLANLESVSVRKLVLGGDDEEDEEEEEVDGSDLTSDLEVELSQPATQKPGGEEKLTFIGEGDAIQLIFKHKLRLNDAPEDFYLNSGSLRLLSQIHLLSKYTTQVFLIEFGAEVKYPVRTFEEESQAYSQHFGILRQAAENMGYRSRLSYWMEDLGLEREVPMFATTRSQFKALRRLLADHGVTLERRPYTKDEFEALLNTAGLGETVVEINYEPAEDRVLGLVPHSYQFLRLFRELEF